MQAMPLLMFAQANADSTLAQRLWLFVGRLHPMLVHFPIALLIVAVLFELLRRRRPDALHRPGSAAMASVVVGAIGAVIAAASGWSDAITSGHTERAVLAHRWLGVAAAAAAVTTLIVALAARWLHSQRTFAAFRALLLVSAASVAAAGHFGAALVHGEAYLRDAFALLRDGPTVSAGHSADVPPTSQRAGAAIADIDFVRDVRPILARRCFNCHVDDEPAGGLHLDDLESMLAGGDSGRPSIVPGDSAASYLLTLITHGDDGLIMPPKGARLDAAQIAIITKWIDRGATWSSAASTATAADDQPAASDSHWHWAYRAPQRPDVPVVKDVSWPRDPIDHFILASLEAEGLAPSPPADRASLIRRVSLDLIGLPPSPHEVADFMADSSADAYERVVDRLLASPHFGERMARPWLDLARYADTHGYEKDDRRVMWPWRDWVINAFNADMPFDRFTIEQLAGDLLPTAGGPSLDQLIATGFSRNSMINEEGGVDPEEFRVEAIIDRVNTYASVWLGSTVACAQCHDHKYDPFSAREYFSLYAFFNQDETDARPHATGATAGGPMVDVPRSQDRERYDRTRREITEVESAIAAANRSASRNQLIARWEQTGALNEPAWVGLVPERASALEGTTFTIAADGVITAALDPSPARDTYVFEALCELETVEAIRLDVLPDEATPAKAVGRSSHGNIVLSDVRIEALDGDRATRIPVIAAAADFEQPRTFGGGGFWPIADAIDGDERTGGWALGPQLQQAHVAVLQLAQPLRRPNPAAPIRLRITLVQNYGGQHTISRLKLSATSEPDALALRPLSPELRAILDTPTAQRNEEQTRQLAAHFESIDPDLAPLNRRLLALRRELNDLTVARAMVMRKADTPRDTHIHIGGNFLNPGETVEPDVPAVLPPLPPPSNDAPRDRLALAKWTVDPANPLTARVAVNRMWEMLFGRGIVFTSDDFGTQGEPPHNAHHAALLDWMATEFMRDGWSVKRALKRIVMSATYQQSSRVSPQLLERDPQNILLARGPRFRVEAEMVRDIALAASGLLVPIVGGPSVFPPQPDGIWTMIYSSDKWTNSTGDDAHRRGLYTFWRRTAPYPSFVSFDAPSREIACTRRARTNTPLQALTTLNDPAFIECAAALARRMLAEGGDDDRSRIIRGYELCVSRTPSEIEIETVLALLRDQRAIFAADPASAQALSGVKDHNAADLAAWQVVANVLLNLDETLTKE